MKQKKVPLRKCIGCNQMKSKKELVRVVKSPSQKDSENNVTAKGEITLDLTGKKPGRGAYVCSNITCLQQARKAGRLEKAFSCKIPQEIYDALEEELSQNER